MRWKRRPITKAPMSVSFSHVTLLFPAIVAVSKGMVGGRIYRQLLGVIACTADVISALYWSSEVGRGGRVTF